MKRPAAAAVSKLWRAILSGEGIEPAARAAAAAGYADTLCDALRLQIGDDLAAGRGGAVNRKRAALRVLLAGGERRAA
jgi:hypothetical protein